MLSSSGSIEIENIPYFLHCRLIKTFIIILLCLLPLQAFAETAKEIQGKIASIATTWHVSAATMEYIVQHESSYDSSEVGDTNLVCEKTGEPQASRGLVQIDDCYWPTITKSQALDDTFALTFLAKNLANGHCNYWTTCPKTSDILLADIFTK